MEDPIRLANLDLVDSIVAITEQRNIETLESVLADTMFALLSPREVVLFDLHDQDPGVVVLLHENGMAPAQTVDLQVAHCAPEIQAALADYLKLPAGERTPDRLPTPPIVGKCGVFPLVNRGEVDGVLCIYATNFNSADWRLATGLAHIYRNFVEVLNEKDHDRLTGLRNRTLLEDQILRRLGAAHRRRGKTVDEGDERRRPPASEEQSWLALFDIDHFKIINDEFGHIYGDEVLLLISALMRKSFRRVDQLYRYGGEEFIILIQGVDQETVHRVLDRFREMVAQFEFPQVGKVTISIGYVEIRDQSQPTYVIGHADQALYYAKRNGRDQIAYYDQLYSEGKIPVSKIGSIELF